MPAARAAPGFQTTTSRGRRATPCKGVGKGGGVYYLWSVRPHWRRPTHSVQAAPVHEASRALQGVVGWGGGAVSNAL